MNGTSLIRGERGFTIIEVMVAMAIMLTGVLGILKMVDQANAVATVTQARSQGNAIVRQIVEDARSLPYGQLSNATAVENLLKALPGLVDDNALDSAWTIKKKRTVYTIQIFALCTVDDAMDGYGNHTTGTSQFCADSTSTGTADSGPDDYKRLTVKLAWKDARGRSRPIRQTTLINNPGAGAGPSVRPDFAMTTPACGTPPPNTSTPPSGCAVRETTPTSTDQATFTLATTDPARTVNWSKDNVFQATATPAASCSGSTCSSWTFTWKLGCLSNTDSRPVCFDAASARIPATVDGSYLIGAQGFDEVNNGGTPAALTVLVNRRAPGVTPGFIAGWNGTQVETEWLPQVDADIAKYQVYRMTGGSQNTSNDALVCDVPTTTTSCVDTAPGAAGTSPQYYVVAYDTNDSGVLRAGTLSSPYTANPANVAPTAPTGFACTSPCTGSVVFNWTAATDSDGTIAFYRIYRMASNGIPATSDRYSRTTGNQTSFEDTDTGTVHHYWVSAVDNSLAESPLAGPIIAGG